MSEGRRVLITGIAGDLAGMTARALEERDDIATIVGIDDREAHHDLRRTDVVHADLHDPRVSRVLDEAGIDTVVHLATTSVSVDGGRYARVRERNVIGAMQLLAACQRAPRLRRFVLRSSTAVYGSDHTDPASFVESAAPRRQPAASGFGKDVTEIEGYARALGRRRSEVAVTVLRFANLLGGRVDSAFHALFTLPVIPTVLGYDPRLQFCHEDDAVAVLVRAATGDHPGIFNVAGDGALYLSQCVRIAGRVPAPVPAPFVSVVADALGRMRRADLSPDQLRFLRFGRVVDTTALREDFGYVPRNSSRGTFEEFVRRRRIRSLIDRDELMRVEHDLDEALRPRPTASTSAGAGDEAGP